MHRHTASPAAASSTVAGRLALVLAALLVPLLQAGCSTTNPLQALTPPQRAPEMRGIWVTRWDYRTAADVERAIDDAAATGFTDVFWQVRGQADAYYRSSLEPWGEDLFRDRPQATDPGFDPLSVAVARAQQRGVRLHAWINVYPLWKGKGQPKDPRHPFVRRPEWRLRDDRGETQPATDHYLIANPTDPAVQSHIAAVCRDIVSRYAVDGLHLDYVRFVGDTLDASRIYPGDPATLSRFNRATGRRGLETVEDKAAHAAWVRDEITTLVRRISRETKRIRPRLELSTAVWQRPEAAREKVLQDGTRWLEEGLIDRALPMIYTENSGEFVEALRAWLEAAGGEPVTPGIGVYRLQPTQTLDQIRLAEPADGYCLFAYATIFESANPFEPKDATAQAVRESRRRALEAVQRPRTTTR